jgi:kynureninase
MKQFQKTKSFAEVLDKEDPLRMFREEFCIPGSEIDKSKTYFLGNSLGLQPKVTPHYIQGVLDQWAANGVESFFMGETPWIHQHAFLVDQMSILAGAKSHEISIMNQLTVNIHLMLGSFYRPSGKRKKILIESKAFPSDYYALSSFISFLGEDPASILIQVESLDPQMKVQDEDVINAIKDNGEEIALVFIGGVNYYTGHVFDMKRIASAAKQVGALVGFDLAHAIGNVSLQLHNWDVDFACWCSYKYLNAGPGAVGGVYIHERYHTDDSIKRLAGWWGYKQEDRFQMHQSFEPESDATGWQLSTPSLILYACLEASLSIFKKAGWERVIEKQKIMSAWIRFLLADILVSEARSMFICITPEGAGCQLSFLFSHSGKEVFDELIEAGYMLDWREPNVIRLAPVPLYNTFTEIWDFCETLKIVLNRHYVKP